MKKSSSLPTPFNFPFLFSRTRCEPSRHLVSNAIFFTRETSNFPSSPFFFVHCAEIARALALPQLIFRRVWKRGYQSDDVLFHGANVAPILQAKLNLYYSEILPRSPDKTGKLISPKALARSYICMSCAVDLVFSLISDVVLNAWLTMKKRTILFKVGY